MTAADDCWTAGEATADADEPAATAAEAELELEELEEEPEELSMAGTVIFSMNH